MTLDYLPCVSERLPEFTFYEIDPVVEKIARNEELFTYLRDYPPQIEVVIGDARISLASAWMHSVPTRTADFSRSAL
jgi:hypothetical protein